MSITVLYNVIDARQKDVVYSTLHPFGRCGYRFVVEAEHNNNEHRRISQ